MAIISMHIHALHILAVATIWEWHLFRSELPIVQLLFEGGVYSKNNDNLVVPSAFPKWMQDILADCQYSRWAGRSPKSPGTDISGNSDGRQWAAMLCMSVNCGRDKAFSIEKRLNNLQKLTWESYVKLGHAQDSRFTCRTPLVAIQRHLRHYKLTVLPLLLILQHQSWFSNLTEGVKYCLVECSFFPGTHHHFMWRL